MAMWDRLVVQAAEQTAHPTAVRAGGRVSAQIVVLKSVNSLFFGVLPVRPVNRCFLYAFDPNSLTARCESTASRRLLATRDLRSQLPPVSEWEYLNGSRNAPSSGVTTATLQFVAPMTAGTYNVRLFASNPTVKLATSALVTVVVPTVTITTASATTGGTIVFTVADGPANPTDWVGLFSTTAGDNAYVDWVYLNGQKTAPANGIAAATLQFAAPKTPGTYNVRLFRSNSSTKLATSNPVTVAAPTATGIPASGAQ
jgi:hypothetical protein